MDDVVGFPVDAGSQARTILHHLLERGEVVGRDSAVRTIITLAIDDWLLQELLTYDAGAEDLEGVGDEEPDDAPSSRALQVISRRYRRSRHKVFKRSSFQQFIRQAEIDVLGLSSGEATLAAVAVDSAFHENGVQYGDLKETVGRILKKMIRTAFALEAYFDLHQADIVFATPKMHNAVQDALQGAGRSCNRPWPIAPV